MMQRVIQINQQAVIELGLDLDLVDMAIFDHICFWANSKFCKRYDTNYFWVSHQKVIDSLPLLGIKSKSGIRKRIQKLIDSGLLELHPDSKQMGMSYYTFGNNFDRVHNFTPLSSQGQAPCPDEDKPHVLKRTSKARENIKQEKKSACNTHAKDFSKKNDSESSEGIDARAFDFLEKKDKGRLEVFLMQHKSQIKDFKKFRADFNDKVDIEGLEYTTKILFARLSTFARNWILIQNKPSSQYQNEKNEPAPSYTKNGF